MEWSRAALTTAAVGITTGWLVSITGGALPPVSGFVFVVCLLLFFFAGTIWAAAVKSSNRPRIPWSFARWLVRSFPLALLYLAFGAFIIEAGAGREQWQWYANVIGSVSAALLWSLCEFQLFSHGDVHN